MWVIPKKTAVIVEVIQTVQKLSELLKSLKIMQATTHNICMKATLLGLYIPTKITFKQQI